MRRREARVRTSRGVLGIAAAMCLLLVMGTGYAQGQAAKASAPAGKATAAPSGDETGLIDVKQSDLLQKQVTANWVNYNGDYSGRRYTAMTQITPANVSRLVPKWVFHTAENGPLEATPVVVAGVMFVTSGNDAYALDAETGKQLWHHSRANTEGLVDDPASHHNRGVAVLGTRVYMTTDNGHLLCLDARSGNLIWDVQFTPANNRNYGATSAPLIVKDKVIVGTAGGDSGIRGFLAAYNARTGKEAWRFWTIPGPGEFGGDSWPNGLYLHGGGGTWMPGTYDPQLNTLYWETGNPTPDYDGSGRPGDDLYTSCTLAFDPDTGKLKWYFQYSPHNLSDYDAEQTPVLVDANFKGQPRKLLINANRNGYLYILDRVTGKYLYSKQFISRLTWAKGIDENGRPISNNLVPDDKGVEFCPSIGGASNWYSPSYDPATHTFYFRSVDSCSVIQRKPEEFQEGRAFYGGGGVRGGGGGGENKSFINAFSLDKLDFEWKDPLIGGGNAWAGVMSTATGLVVFSDNAENFVAVDARTGKPLWHFNLGQVVHASPMSYAVNGKQYFAISAGSGDVFAFALP